MDFLASNTFVLLAVAVAFFIATALFQIRNMRKLLGGNRIRIAPILICGGGFSLSFLLFLIGLLVSLIKMAKA